MLLIKIASMRCNLFFLLRRHIIFRMRKYHVNTLGQFLFKLQFYIRYGYVHYYSRTIPAHKNLEDIDKKLVLLYDVTFNRNLRNQRKKKGLRNVIYIRYKSNFILLATEGKNTQFDRVNYSDFRHNPFHFYHYTIGTKQGKPHIQIANKFYATLRKKARIIAHHNSEKVEEFLKGMSPYTYRGITKQRWKLYKLINEKRKKAKIKRVKWENLIR